MAIDSSWKLNVAILVFRPRPVLDTVDSKSMFLQVNLEIMNQILMRFSTSSRAWYLSWDVEVVNDNLVRFNDIDSIFASLCSKALSERTLQPCNAWNTLDPITYQIL